MNVRIEIESEDCSLVLKGKVNHFNIFLVVKFLVCFKNLSK